jgi:Cys-tRNA synthase (O-phospho-L-seryl-tRNA:Cys-tRNA synthase)
MMYDIGVEETPTQRNFYRVHSSVLSQSVRNLQRRGFFIFSIRELHPIKTIQPESELSKAGLSQEKLNEVREQVEPIDPIDPDSMTDSHGY